MRNHEKLLLCFALRIYAVLVLTREDIIQDVVRDKVVPVLNELSTTP
jgi:hypothetical protein